MPTSTVTAQHAAADAAAEAFARCREQLDLAVAAKRTMDEAVRVFALEKAALDGSGDGTRLREAADGMHRRMAALAHLLGDLLEDMDAAARAFAEEEGRRAVLREEELVGMRRTISDLGRQARERNFFARQVEDLLHERAQDHPEGSIGGLEARFADAERKAGMAGRADGAARLTKDELDMILGS